MKEKPKPASSPRASSERATLRDVARLAEVSEISVSRVMRNAPNISDALRKRVRHAADALGYTPNRVAGTLKTAMSNMIAVVLPTVSNEVFPPMLDGIEAVLSERGLVAALGVTQYDPDREVETVRELLSWSPAGLILTGMKQKDAIHRMLARQPIPVVQTMDIEGTPIQHAVGFKHTDAGIAAADLLIARGWRRPGYVGAFDERPDRSRTRRLAFETRLKALGHPLVGARIMQGPPSAPVGRAATAELLAAYPETDCIFYATDDLGIGGLFHCMQKEIAVPKRLGLLGFNGIETGKAAPTPLTSIETPRFEIGRQAAELMLLPADAPGSVKDLGFKLTDGRSI